MQKGFWVFMVTMSLAACNDSSTTISVKEDSIGRELDKIGEKIEEKTEKAADKIEEKAEQVSDSVKATYKDIKESVKARIDSIKKNRNDATE